MNYLDAIKQLNNATEAYDKGSPIMSDKEWDNLYFQVWLQERTQGYADPTSPTQIIYYNIKNELQKVEHNHPMLSLDKTKNINDIVSFAKGRKLIAMGKIDGLTCSLYYNNGKLVRAETRGNGHIGEDVTHNALVIPSIPKIINVEEEMVIDGEIICLYDDFMSFSDDYKNPRNFAAGSIRLLDSQECAKRKLTFVAWDLVRGPRCQTFSEKLTILSTLGFITTPWTDKNPEESIEFIKYNCIKSGYPIDGIVFKFDDVEYGESLGATAHHARNAIAYKFYDETYTTYLKDIEWSMGRTGVLTPIAIFEPVDIDGSTVERASLHNYSIMMQTLKHPYKGQEIEVFKANAIIPQIAECFVVDDDLNVDYIQLPQVCPVCGGTVKIEKSATDIENLICTNRECSGKIINQFNHFCGKSGLDIKGLSLATLNKLIEWGWLSDLHDVFTLENYRKEWSNKVGFGVKSVDNILNAISTARNTDLPHFISSLGIPLIGLNVAKDICKYINSYEQFRDLINQNFNFSSWSGFGFEKSNSLLSFNYTEADIIYGYLTINTTEQNNDINGDKLNDMTIVITGKLNNFKNRKELEDIICSYGGKVGSSITAKTTYLINNDINSTSSKNEKAKSLGIKIISEEEFCEKYLQN